MNRAANQRPGNFRPSGRTVGGRKPIGGRIPQAEALRQVKEAFRLGQRIAEMRQERDYDRDDPDGEYQRGFADAMNMVDEDDAREARRPKPMDLGGLGYSEWWTVYAAVMDDLGGLGMGGDE